MVATVASANPGGREFLALLKTRPGQLHYASTGNGSMLHLQGELMKSMTGAQMVHVPYKSGVQPLNDLMAGRIPMTFAGMPPVLT